MPVSKQDIISDTHAIVMRILYDSMLYGTSLWPKKGFVSGFFNNGKSDIITIGFVIELKYDYKKVRFNIWNKSYARALKQHKALVLIFDQCIKDGVYFYAEYPEHVDYMGSDEDDGIIMGILDFKFETPIEQ